jgi:hypothetical protein
MEYLPLDELQNTLLKLLLSIENTEYFSKEKIIMEKHREEWPELWEILDSMVLIKVLNNKFDLDFLE